ncbi:hypothetical protein JOB18_020412 [Solea senegalensis]|uniref:Uncharacterized protein n=1 Tax=Solea senegalensis TaxID=28829 RepID=A0AAV6SX82_SOLSE|nr:hypothetical protein JOB18_020412 [Solea senegalensis]
MHAVHHRLQTPPQRTRTTSHIAPPPQHRSRNNLDLTLPTIPEEEIPFSTLPPPQAPQRLSIYRGTSSTTAPPENTPSTTTTRYQPNLVQRTPTCTTRQPSRTLPDRHMTDFFPPSSKPLQKPAKRTRPIIPLHLSNQQTTQQPTFESQKTPTTQPSTIVPEPNHSNTAPATSTPLPQRTKKVTWGPTPIRTATRITALAPAPPIYPILHLTPPTTSHFKPMTVEPPSPMPPLSQNIP